jgi:predicted transcriptional regulator
MDASIETDPKVLELTAQIVAAHVSHNSVTAEALPQLIQEIYRTLTTLGKEKEASAPQPKVPVKKSVQPEHVVCLECGKKFKMLRRHLSTHHNLTPEEYREKWGLPLDYPLVAPNYAKQRSVIAKENELGKRHQSGGRQDGEKTEKGRRAEKEEKSEGGEEPRRRGRLRRK